METLNDIWNEKRTGRLQTLYRDGLSFRLIANDIGVTRNAVIGKAHRMNLPKRTEVVQSKPPPPSEPKPPRPRRRYSVVVKPPLPLPPPPVVVIPGHDYRCSIYELTDSKCRFPLWQIGTPHPQRLYCGCPGADVSGGVPYCRRHMLRVCSPR